MISKKRRNSIFLEAAILTLVVYLFAIIVNGYLDQERVDELDYNFYNSSIEIYNIEVSESFFENFDIDNCEMRKEFIFDSFRGLKSIGTDLGNYGQLFLSENENLSKFKQREYFLRELFLYQKTLSYNDVCKNESLFTVIYFYNSLSNDFDRQSLILEQFYLNHKNESIIFSFDINYEDEPILEEFKKEYNITNAPFVILENKTSRDYGNIIDLNSLTIEYKRFRGEI